MENHKRIPKIGIGVLVVHNGNILLLKRNNSHGAGSWCLGGGHLEFGETIADCARREVYEETGLTLDTVEIICVNEELDFIGTDNKHYVTIGCVAESKSDFCENREPFKHTGISWFAFDALPKPLFTPSEHIITCYLSKTLTLSK